MLKPPELLLLDVGALALVAVPPIAAYSALDCAWAALAAWAAA